MRARGGLATLSVLVLVCCTDAPQPTWHQEPGYRWARLHVPGQGEDGFERLAPKRTGIEFVNRVTEEQILDNEHVLNGSGVALGDVDGDGDVDLYFTRLDGPNVLYRNLGRWRFEDITDLAGVAAPGRLSTGAAFADVDGDGDLDLLVTSMGGPHSLFENDGSGVFTDRTAESGLAAGFYGTTMALADVEGDGDLDLYVANNKLRTLRDLLPPDSIGFDRVVEDMGGRFEIREEFRDHYALERSGNVLMRIERAEPDKFYLNDGTGRFEEVDFTAGRFRDTQGRPLTTTPTDWGLSARFYDFDGDGDPDLYVSNDFESPDHVWINDGTGTFQTLGFEALRTTSNANMALDFADVDRDGDVDMLQVDMLDPSSAKQRTQTPASVVMLPTIGEPKVREQLPRNVLLVNRGDGTFAEVALYAGVEASGWTWSVLFIDVDLDGYEDILVGNGHELDFLDTDTRDRIRRLPVDGDWRQLRFLYPKLHLHNVAYRNRGDLTFELVEEGWGLGREPDVSHGMAAADLDGDGDLDVVINRLGASAGVYRNTGTRSRIRVSVEGTPPNTQGVGAKIHVFGGPTPIQSTEVTLGGAYLSSSEPSYTFAAGDTVSLAIAVEWRDGTWSLVPDAPPNHQYVIDQKGAQQDPPAWLEVPEPESSRPRPFFTDVTAELNHRHNEEEYDDFRRQPLLWRKLSQAGPGVTWSDIDRDGDEDLLIGTGRGGALAVYRNDDGRLTPITLRMPQATLDQTTLLAVPGLSGHTSILVGQMNYEAVSPDAATAAASVFALDIAPSTWGTPSIAVTPTTVVPGIMSSTGPLALADYDGDGDLDLFVGGLVLPSRYPMPASSRLFLNEHGSFVLDSANSAVLRERGLVSGTVFSDVDGDGDPDLVVALEWGPLTLFINDSGRFSDATEAWGLSEYPSLWNGVTAGDLNGDGLPDLVATSWGLNTRFRPSAERPLRIYFADFDRNGTMDVVTAQYDPRVGDVVPLPGLQHITRAMPYVTSRFASLAEYADATIRDVLGPPLADAMTLEVTTLAHRVFLNRGGRFEPRLLPAAAQFAPAFHAGVTDFDGDGFEDVFITQNFYPTEENTQRYDAGRSLWMRGDGEGNLEAVPGTVSGVTVYGDQRGAAFADYNGDGRVDLVVSQNAGVTRLYRNDGARPGLRVRLAGPPSNPDAIGAVMRLVYAGGRGRGPAREIHAGAGYWSGDGPVQVLGMHDVPDALWVRWPGGEEIEVPVAPGEREITVTWKVGT